MELEFSRSPALTIAVALAAGMVVQVAARHFRVPSIVLLLVTGVLLGPEGAGLVLPAALGDGLTLIVGMSVGVILFEGGLNLNLARLRGEALTIRRLVTVGAVITGAGGTVAARLLMGWSWELSALFGSLVIVTGPTVMTPLLRRIRVNSNLHTILEGEGVLIDPVGAIIAVVTLEIVVSLHVPEAGSGAFHLVGIPVRLGVGAVLGLLGGGFLLAVFSREELVPDELENVLTLALVLALYEVSEAVQAESGIMATAVAGIVVGNFGSRVAEELRAFKEQLTMLLIGLLFVLLAATVTLESLLGLGWRGLATIAALMFVVRPLDVAVSSAGSSLTIRERAFLSWLAPRGIVAAAIASLVAQWLGAEGLAGGPELQALVFLVIAVTVVVQGGSSRWVASALDVMQREERGYVLVGANPLARLLARALRVAGEEVVLVDSDAESCQEAEDEGLPVVYGDATSERAVRQTRLERRRGLLAVTPRQGTNLLLVRELLERVEPEISAAALDSRRKDVARRRLDRGGAAVLFGRSRDLGGWIHHLDQGLVDVSAWRWEGEPGADLAPDDWTGAIESESLLPLVVVRDDRGEPVTDRHGLAAGDVVFFAWPYLEGDRAGRWLERTGWTPVASV